MMKTLGDETSGQMGDTTTTITTSSRETGQMEDDISMEVMTPEREGTERSGKSEQTVPTTMT